MTVRLPLWHLTHVADWQAALADGQYAVSTRGRTLAEEGFIHASHPHQVGTVARAFYADDPEPLLVLEIDPDALDAAGVAVRVEDVGDGRRYPHIYGAVPVSAVTAVRAAEFDERGGFLLGDQLDPGALGT